MRGCSGSRSGAQPLWRCGTTGGWKGSRRRAVRVRPSSVDLGMRGAGHPWSAVGPNGVWRYILAKKLLKRHVYIHVTQEMQLVPSLAMGLVSPKLDFCMTPRGKCCTRKEKKGIFTRMQCAMPVYAGARQPWKDESPRMKKNTDASPARMPLTEAH